MCSGTLFCRKVGTPVPHTHKGFYLWNFSDFVILLHAILRLRMHSVPLNSEGMNSFAQKSATAGLSVWWRLGAQTIQQASRLNVEHAFSLMVLSSEVHVNNCSPTTFNGWDLWRAEILLTRERNDTPPREATLAWCLVLRLGVRIVQWKYVKGSPPPSRGRFRFSVF